MSLVITILLGISGSSSSGLLYSHFLGDAAEPFWITSPLWFGLIVALPGAMLLVGAYKYYNCKISDRLRIASVK